MNVLMTSVGNDGFPTVLQAVKGNLEREVRVIGVDMRPAAAGLYLADRGYVVPPRGAQLITRLLKICHDEKVDVVYPLSTEDQEFFAAAVDRFEERGISVIVSPLSALQIANDKLCLCEFAQANGIPCPQFVSVQNLDELYKAMYSLEFPFVIKLNRGTGAQGFKVVYVMLDARRRFLDRDNRDVAFREVESWLSGLECWPPMHAAEYLPGKEYSVDILCDKGKILAAVTRLRLSIFYGLAMHAQVVDEPDVQEAACELVKKLGLSYVVNVQFRRDASGVAKLMEINPRIPGTIGLTVAAGINMPYLALKIALGESFKPPQPLIGMIVLRHWDMVCIHERQML